MSKYRCFYARILSLQRIDKLLWIRGPSESLIRYWIKNNTNCSIDIAANNLYFDTDVKIKNLKQIL